MIIFSTFIIIVDRFFVADILDCKTVVFGRFRKVGSAVIVILELSLAVFSLALDLSFEYGPSLAFAKNTAVLQSTDIQTQVNHYRAISKLN